MPLAFALLSVEQGQQLLVVPADGISLGSVRVVLQQFVSLAVFDAGRRSEEELCMPTGEVVHYKVLPGDAVVGAVVCEAWENPYEGKDSLADLEMVASAVSKGGELTDTVLARRYCDAFIAIEGLTLGDTRARESILNGLAPGVMHTSTVTHASTRSSAARASTSRSTYILTNIHAYIQASMHVCMHTYVLLIPALPHTHHT
jgi:hypothetical protein